MNNNIRVLIIQSQIPHYRVSIFNYLATQYNFDLTVICSSPVDTTTPLRFKCILVKERQINGFYYQYEILQHAEKYDVVIAMFNIRYLSLFPLLIKYHKKLILWGHGLGESYILNKIKLFASKTAVAILTYGDAGREAYIRNGIQHSKVFVANNTVHVKDPFYDRNSKRDKFIYVGRLQERKRLVELLEAFARIESKISDDVGIIIVGSGDVYDSLVTLSEKLKIKHKIQFTGAIHEEEKLKKIFSQAVASISPGAVGLGVLHSFASGVPMVTNKSDSQHGPEVENIIDGFNGVLYEGGIHILSSIMIGLIEDRAFSESLRENAYSFYQQYRTIDCMAEGFKSIIEYTYDSYRNTLSVTQ